MSKRTLHTYFCSSSGTSTTLGTNDSTNQPKIHRVEFSQSDVVGDRGNCKPIKEYVREIRDQVRRAHAPVLGWGRGSRVFSACVRRSSLLQQCPGGGCSTQF
jgi:hypothetical protein